MVTKAGMVVGALFGAVFTFIVIFVIIDSRLAIARVSEALITDCEEFIPRNQNCKLIAVIEGEK